MSVFSSASWQSLLHNTARYTMAFLHNFKANVGLSQMLNNDIIKEVKTERCHDFFFDMLNEVEDFITDDKKIFTTSVSKDSFILYSCKLPMCQSFFFGHRYVRLLSMNL